MNFVTPNSDLPSAKQFSLHWGGFGKAKSLLAGRRVAA
jgi:hypothetical protein